MPPAGSVLHGNMLVRGAVARVDRLFDADTQSAIMGPGGTVEDPTGLLRARLTQSRSGASGLGRSYGEGWAGSTRERSYGPSPPGTGIGFTPDPVSNS